VHGKVERKRNIPNWTSGSITEEKRREEKRREEMRIKEGVVDLGDVRHSLIIFGSAIVSYY
jgi:hypothetical protein